MNFPLKASLNLKSDIFKFIPVNIVKFPLPNARPKLCQISDRIYFLHDSQMTVS